MLIFPRGMWSTPVVMQPSTTGRYWDHDVVTELVSQVHPIDALWGAIQGCMVASQVEPHCSGSESRGRLQQHGAWHYLVGVSDCVAAQKEQALTSIRSLY